MRKVLIGLGSGRCGTFSLSHFLNMQKGANVTHENFSITWMNFETQSIQELCNILIRDEHIVGDVACYWLNYVPFMIPFCKDIKFVCLQRDREETVRSFFERKQQPNFCVSPESKYYVHGHIDHLNDYSFPKYDLPKHEGVYQYYDDYYHIARGWHRAYPYNFKLLPMDSLNTNEGQNEILEFCGIPIEDRVFQEKCHYNSNSRQTLHLRPVDQNAPIKFKCGMCENLASANLMSKFHSMTKFVCDDCIDKAVIWMCDKSGVKEYDLIRGIK